MSPTNFKRNLYIHIGLPKTGTSAIQKSLSENRDALISKFSLLYPKLGEWVDGSHHGLAFAMGMNPYQKILSEQSQVKMLEKLQEEIDESGCNNILLSSECFHLYNNERFIEFSKAYNVYIICYLRKTDTYMESLYTQNVQDPVVKEARCFKSYIDENSIKVDYLAFLKRWFVLCKQNNFFVKLYDKERSFKGRDLLVGFYSIFGIDPVLNNFCSNKTVNASFDPIVSNYKLLLNRVLKKQSDELVYLLRRYKQDSSSKGNSNRFLTEELSEKILSLHNESEEELSATFGIDSKSLFCKGGTGYGLGGETLTGLDVYKISRHIYIHNRQVFMEIEKQAEMFNNTDFPEYDFDLCYILQEVYKNESS